MDTNNQRPAISKEQIAVALKMGENREFRQKLRDHDADALAQTETVKNLDDGASPEIKVVTSTQDVTYLRMPFRADPPDQPVTSEQLAQIQGGISPPYPCLYDPACLSLWGPFVALRGSWSLI